MNKFFTLLTILVISCKSAEPSASSSFKMIYQSEYGGNENENLTVLYSKEQCFEALDKLSIASEVIEELLATDFNKYAIAFISMGQKNNGGFSIKVKSIQLQEKILIMEKEITGPKPLEPVTMALTNPYCLVKVTKHKAYQLK